MDPRPGRIDALDPLDEADVEIDEVEVTITQIEQTRAAMGQTIEAIKEKLNPQTLMEQAKETVREATVGRVQDMASNVVDSAKEAAGSVVETASNVVDTAREKAGSVVEGAERALGSASATAREAGSSLMETIQRNPVPSALIGIGLGWLWMNRQREEGPFIRRDSRSRSESYPWSEYEPSFRSNEPAAMRRGPAATAAGLGETLDQAKERVAAAADQAKERVGETLDQAKERVGATAGQVQQRVSEMGQTIQYQASQATDSLQQWVYQNPLAASAVALALGAAVGMAVPETPQEQRWLGETRDRLVDKAQQTAQEVGQKVQAVAHEAIDTAREQARTQGLTA